MLAANVLKIHYYVKRFIIAAVTYVRLQVSGEFYAAGKIIIFKESAVHLTVDFYMYRLGIFGITNLYFVPVSGKAHINGIVQIYYYLVHYAQYQKYQNYLTTFDILDKASDTILYTDKMLFHAFDTHIYYRDFTSAKSAFPLINVMYFYSSVPLLCAQRSAIGHSLHFGARAVQTSRPKFTIR